jgi:glycine cleavage system H protein
MDGGRRRNGVVSQTVPGSFQANRSLPDGTLKRPKGRAPFGAEGESRWTVMLSGKEDRDARRGIRLAFFITEHVGVGRRQGGGKMKVIEGLYYTEDHEWLKVEGDAAYVGVTDFAQSKLGGIVYVELPEAGESFGKGEVFGVIESVKVAADLMLPVSGVVLEKNDAVEETPESVNDDAYATWLVKIEISDPTEVEDLMNAAGYTEFTKE